MLCPFAFYNIKVVDVVKKERGVIMVTYNIGISFEVEMKDIKNMVPELRKQIREILDKKYGKYRVQFT
jgi:hypothetical protein